MTVQKLKAIYAETIGIVEDEFPESTAYLKTRLDAMDNSVPCRLVLGDARVMQHHAPATSEIPDDVNFDDLIIHQYRPGAEAAVNIHTKAGQTPLRDVQIPDLNKVIVLGGAGVSVQNLTKTASTLIELLEYVDHLLFVNGSRRLVTDEVEVIKLICQIHQHLPGSNRSELPLLYVHHILNIDPEESRQIFEANLASLKDLNVHASFEINEPNDGDPAFARLREYLDTKEEEIRQNQTELAKRDLVHTVTSVRDNFVEKAKVYAQNHDDQQNHDTLTKQRTALHQLRRDKRYATEPQREIDDALLRQGNKLSDKFSTVENGDPSLYSKLIATTKDVVLIGEDLRPSAKYDRARYKANSLLVTGYTAAISESVEAGNENLSTIMNKVKIDLDSDVKAIGLKDFVIANVNNEIDPAIPAATQMPELNPIMTPSTAEKIFRYGISGYAGGNLGVTVAGLAAKFASTGAAAGSAGGPVGITVGVVVGALVGGGIGLYLAHSSVESQTEKAYEVEFTKKTSEICHYLSIQSNRAWTEFFTAWKRELADYIDDMFNAAHAIVDTALEHTESVSNLTPQELKTRADHYTTLVERLETVLETIHN